MKVYQNKPMILLATSPGPGGASSVLATAKTSAPHFGGRVVGDLSISRFYEHFDLDSGKITTPEIQQQLLESLAGLILEST